MKTSIYGTNQKGFALVIALIMLLVLTLIGSAAVNLTSYEARISGTRGSITMPSMPGTEASKNFRGRVSTGEFVYLVATSEVTRLPSAIV